MFVNVNTGFYIGTRVDKWNIWPYTNGHSSKGSSFSEFIYLPCFTVTVYLKVLMEKVKLKSVVQDKIAQVLTWAFQTQLNLTIQSIIRMVVHGGAEPDTYIAVFQLILHLLWLDSCSEPLQGLRYLTNTSGHTKSFWMFSLYYTLTWTCQSLARSSRYIALHWSNTIQCFLQVRQQ